MDNGSQPQDHNTVNAEIPSLEVAMGMTINKPRAEALSPLLGAKSAPLQPGKRCAIVGSSSNSLGKVPWDDTSIEIWGLAWRQGQKRVNRAFDLHRLNHTRMAVPENYTQYLAGLGIPVYLQRKHKEIPNAIAYPFDEVADEFGEYFASSVAYMVALAIYEGYAEIQLHGIDLFDGSEYGYQRPNAEYLLGVARGRGIRVTVPPMSALLKYTHRYGYDLPPNHGTITKQMVQERMVDYQRQHEEIMMKAAALDGIRQELDSILKALDFASKGRVGDV